MMQMLVAGGMTSLSDGERGPDTDNPRGYLEWEKIKQLPNDPDCIAEAEGKVVKVISQLLFSLPAGHEYRIIFMQRPMLEVLASQDQMLRRLGKYNDGADLEIISRHFEKQLRQVAVWLNVKPHVKALWVDYHDALRDPRGTAEKLTEFLGIELNLDAMAQQVDESLYRNRGK